MLAFPTLTFGTSNSIIRQNVINPTYAARHVSNQHLLVTSVNINYPIVYSPVRGVLTHIKENS